MSMNFFRPHSGKYWSSIIKSFMFSNEYAGVSKRYTQAQQLDSLLDLLARHSYSQKRVPRPESQQQH
jgi:hypothetical protein